MRVAPRLPMPRGSGKNAELVEKINRLIHRQYARLETEVQTLRLLQPVDLRNQILLAKSADLAETEILLDEVRLELLRSRPLDTDVI